MLAPGVIRVRVTVHRLAPEEGSFAVKVVCIYSAEIVFSFGKTAELIGLHLVALLFGWLCHFFLMS